MDSWFKIVELRKEVREGRSFNPDEFAIHLEQVVAKTAPEDYRNPTAFFSRTCFTRALREHVGMVLRRLTGQTQDTAPVMTFITQFGGGKTHTLTALYHLAENGKKADKFTGVDALIQETSISSVPEAKVAVFVGNAWDPQEGRETPWIDLARQLAGDNGVKELGKTAKTTPPGTAALERVFKLAGKPVLVLFDEVLNFANRHRNLIDPFYAFIQNLTVAMTATTRGAAVISLPRSQVEMTEWDLQWQEKITKVVRRVAKDLIVNDESEIGEVIRRRLFEKIGIEQVRKKVAKAYADWCFERRAQLPPEWTAVDTASTEKKAREFLQKRFEDCYPFHPATLSVFQRKWASLSQYQQTRGTLAMFAQWISWASKEHFIKARQEPLITLGSAPLDVPEFRSVILGQLGEPRLLAAIESDIAGDHAHAKVLDADTSGPLRDIHRRVATTILFESSGGQIDKVAHLPELRFALGEPKLDTTSIDTAALGLEAKTYYIRKVGSDGFRIYHQPTLKKVVSDRRASLDLDTDVRPTMRSIVQKQFEKGASIPIAPFPADGAAVPDTPKLTLVLMTPDAEWTESSALRKQIAEWTKRRGTSDRLYPGALVWCVRKPGKDLQNKVENWLAWKRVADEANKGLLGSDFDRTDISTIHAKVTDAEEDAVDEVWASYRFVIIADHQERDGVRRPAIDLGAGHASGPSETLCGRVVGALKSEGILSEGIGVGYLNNHWPTALKDKGEWPLVSLRQSFVNGVLTRLLDPDAILRRRISEFVEKGDFGLASGSKTDGTYEHVWFDQPVGVEEITFDANVFLLTKARAKIAKTGTPNLVEPERLEAPESEELKAEEGDITGGTDVKPEAGPKATTFRLTGSIPSEQWNRLGTKLLPKLRSGDDLKIGIEFSVTFKKDVAQSMEADLRQALQDLGLQDKVQIDKG